MSKRDIVKIQKKSHYSVRNKKGQFTDITNINESVRADCRNKNAKTVKPGHGHEGDLAKKRKPRAKK